MRMLLAQVAAYDNRKLGDGILAVWMSTFEGYAYEEVRWALYQHIRTSTEYLIPAHLIAIIAQKRDEYRMMNPGRAVTNTAWLEFEEMQKMAAREVAEIRSTGERYAVEAMDSGEYDDEQ